MYVYCVKCVDVCVVSSVQQPKHRSTVNNNANNTSTNNTTKQSFQHNKLNTPPTHLFNENPLLPHTPSTITSLHTNYSTVKEVHSGWLADVESHVVNLSRQIHTLVWNPTILNNNTIIDNTINRKQSTSLLIQTQTNTLQHATIPLPDTLIYKLLTYIDSLQSVCNGHYNDGEQRVRAMEPIYLNLIEELKVSRGE